MTEYPLKQLFLIKKMRLEEAERMLKQAKEQLKKAEAKLERAKKKCQEVVDRKNNKLKSLRDSFKRGTTSDKIEEIEVYIKEVIQEELKVEEENVQKEMQLVKKAEEAVEEARKNHYKKHQALEKIELHKKEWEKETKYEEIIKENIETDELGSIGHYKKRK